MNTTFVKRILPTLIVLGTVSLTAAGGCGSGGTSSLPPVTVVPSASPTATPAPSEAVSTTGRYGNLRLTLTAPKRSYAVGETVPLTVMVQNTGTSDVKIVSPSPVPVGDVTDGAGNFVASLVNRPTSRTSIVYAISVPAGQTQTFFLEWSSRSNNVPPFDQTAPGIYFINSRLLVGNIVGASPIADVFKIDPLTIIVQ